MVFSPDGTRLASASADGTVKLWNVATREEIATLEGHEDQVWSVVFSPDGRLLASASLDRTVKLWNVATGLNIATLEGHEDWVWSVVFSPDGRGWLRDQGMKRSSCGRGKQKRNRHPRGPYGWGHFGSIFAGWDNAGFRVR